MYRCKLFRIEITKRRKAAEKCDGMDSFLILDARWSNIFTRVLFIETTMRVYVFLRRGERYCCIGTKIENENFAICVSHGRTTENKNSCGTYGLESRQDLVTSIKCYSVLYPRVMLHCFD